MRVLHYLNQFFGGIGGEDHAGEPPRLVDGAVGPGRALEASLGEPGSVVATIICGDNYFVEEEERSRRFVQGAIDKRNPDVIVAGPAFDAGRYGLACGLVCKIAGEAGIPAVTAMHPDNTGVLTYRREMICVPTGAAVAEMPRVVSRMAELAARLAAGEKLGSAREEGYIPRGFRRDVIREKRGAERAVDMVLARIAGRDFESEIVIRGYDPVAPPPPLPSLRDIKIAIVTSGGLVPSGNPDRLTAARAEEYFRYPIDGLSDLEVGEWETIHGGYGHKWVNERDPNYVVPLRALRELEAQGEIGSIYPHYLATTGNGTAVNAALRMGERIVEELSSAGVGAVILVAT